MYIYIYVLTPWQGRPTVEFDVKTNHPNWIRKRRQPPVVYINDLSFDDHPPPPSKL